VDYLSEAHAIHAADQIVGFLGIWVDDQYFGRAVFWEGGQGTDLGRPAG
jgi:hypothetical protein